MLCASATPRPVMMGTTTALDLAALAVEGGLVSLSKSAP